MTGRCFSRHLFWKECRQMQGLWLGVLGLIVVLQLVVTLVMVTTGEAKHLAEALLGVAVMLPVLYALGCGAALFAMEHENGTYDFLRALPTRPAASLLNKLAFAAVSTPLLVVAGGLSAAIPAWLLGGDKIPLLEATVLWSCAAAYLFVWAVFFSLLVRQVVKAVVLAAFAALFCLLFPVGLLLDMSGLTENSAIAVIGPTIFLTVAVLDAWLGVRWFREKRSWRLGPQRRVSDEELALESAFALERMPSKRGPFLHLLWHQWRQSRGMVWTFSIVLFPVLFVLAGPVVEGWNWARWFLASWAPLAVFAGIMIVPLAGTGVFAGDQKRLQFRFLTERGVSPRQVWWSRQSVWLGAMTVWGPIVGVFLLLFLLQFVLPRGTNWPRHVPFLAFPLATVLCVPVAFCFGQFCSMMFRSGVLSGTFAVVGSLFLAQWSLYMAILHVPLVFSVLPIPIVLLIATRLRTRGWMLERNTPGAWLPVVSVVLIPVVLILWGVCAYRAYQYPPVDPGFDVAAFTAPASSAAQETARMYQQAAGLVGEGGDGEKALALLLAASERPECDGLAQYFPGPDQHVEAAHRMGEAVLKQGQRLQEEGDLDGAAKCCLAALRMTQQWSSHASTPLSYQKTVYDAQQSLIAWSVQPGQSKERVLNALRSVEEVTQQPVPMDNVIQSQYVELHKVLTGEMVDMYQWMSPAGQDQVAGAMAIYRLPWERERAERLLAWIVSRELKKYRDMQAELANGWPVRIEIADPVRTSYWMNLTPDVWAQQIDLQYVPQFAVAFEVERRALRLQMALAAWQLEHGSLPQELGELKGEYLAETPLDPYSGEPFVYFPEGLSQRVTRYVGLKGLEEWIGKKAVETERVGLVTSSPFQSRTAVEGGEPFFWSTGPGISVGRPVNTSPTSKYQVRRGYQHPALPEDIWAFGYAFPIPQPD